MVSIGSSFDDFDFVINPFQFSGMNGVVTVVENPIPVAFKGVGKLGDSFVSDSAGQSAPLIDSLVGPGPRPIRPDVFEFFFENHDRVDGFVQFQEFLQMHSVLASSDVGSVFQQQILGSFEDAFVA